MSNLKSFEELSCWQACRKLRIFVARKIAPILPKEEQYGLKRQILNAARSTTANIAEGYGRFHHLDNSKFCSNSRGSTWEVLDHLISAHDEGMIEENLLIEGRSLVNEAVRITNGYIKYLKTAAQKA